jgi:hypothetical protein
MYVACPDPKFVIIIMLSLTSKEDLCGLKHGHEHLTNEVKCPLLIQTNLQTHLIIPVIYYSYTKVHVVLVQSLLFGFLKVLVAV